MTPVWTTRVVVASCVAAVSLPFLVSGLLQYRASVWWLEARELDCGVGAEAARALELYREGRTRLDWNGWFLADYGDCLEKAGRLEEAIRRYEKATSQRADPYALEKLADLYARNGSLEEAIRSASMASLMLPWRLSSKAQLMVFHSEAGQEEKARAYARELLLTPMKVNSLRGLRLKQRARRHLARGTLSDLDSRSNPDNVLSLVSDPWKKGVALALEIAGENREELARALRQAPPGLRGDLAFLIANMPETDQVRLTAQFLLADVQAARSSRDLFPFLEEIPDEIFRNYVLPYTQMGEPQARSRTELKGKAAPLLKDVDSVEEAILTLKRDLPRRLGVGCDGRPKASLQKGQRSGRPGCLEGAIFLADGLRSVGIPARVALIQRWAGESHGYAWTEVYVRGHWRSIGIDETSRLDRSWFHDRASRTNPDRPENRIYAVSFARTELNLEPYGADVWWEDVTRRYLDSVEHQERAGGASVDDFRSPEVLSSHVIFSPDCSKIVYSSNRDDLVRPFVLALEGREARVEALLLQSSRDFFARSLAPDCDHLALVGDRGGKGRFDVFLYDLKRGHNRNLTRSRAVDDGDPLFSPRGSFLAYLSDGRLALYDLANEEHRRPAEQALSFESLTWSEDGKSIFLVDEPTNIWEYRLSPGSFSLVWKTPRRSYTPRSISQHEHSLYFSSDHESEFVQLYELDLVSGSLTRLLSSPHDQYALEKVAGRYLFRTNRGGNFVAAELHGGTLRTLSPDRGVVYGFSLDFDEPLFVYSSDQLPTSIYELGSAGPRSLIPGIPEVHQPPARTVLNSAGMENFLYLPDSPPQRWLLWLHGGPHEQVSPRFNPYFDYLVRRGFAVMALNYPGSTGIGNHYELRDVSPEERVSIQLRQIERDIEQLESLYPSARSYDLVGVSYGSILAHRLLARQPEKIDRLVDFSGIASSRTVGPICSADPSTCAPVLFIFGKNDVALWQPDRIGLMKSYEKLGATQKLMLDDEGHFIKRRRSMDLILGQLDRFLKGPR